MSWKKNVVGYLTWFLYTLMTGVLLTGAVGMLCTGAGLSFWFGYLSAAAYAAVSAAVVYGIYRLSPRLLAWKEKNRGLFLMLEAVLFLAFLLTGVFLRAGRIGDARPPSVYYDMAEVVADGSVPQKVHGAAHMYVWLLHIVFTMVGNQYGAGIWLQIVLQVAAFLGLFFVIRSLYGSAAAMVVFGFGMCGPYMTENAMVLSPEILYFCIFTAALAWTVRIRRGRLNPVVYLFTGVLAAFCIYMDVAGFLVLILACWTVFSRRDTETGSGRTAALVLCLAGAVLGLMACVSIDAFASGKALQGVIRAWILLYQPEAFSLPFSVGGVNDPTESLVLAGMMTFGIFSFWCDRQEERISPYIAAACSLVLAACSGIPTEEMPGFYYLYLICTILAGLGVASMLNGKETENRQDAEDTWEGSESGEEWPEECRPLSLPERQNSAGSPAGEKKEGDISAEEESVQKEMPEKQIKYLENPLPLPRKHVRREMDFPLQTVTEKDDYDHPVCQDDDFDI